MAWCKDITTEKFIKIMNVLCVELDNLIRYTGDVRAFIFSLKYQIVWP